MKVLLKYLATYSNAIHVYARKIENLKKCSLFSVPSPLSHLYTVNKISYATTLFAIYM